MNNIITDNTMIEGVYKYPARRRGQQRRLASSNSPARSERGATLYISLSSDNDDDKNSDNNEIETDVLAAPSTITLEDDGAVTLAEQEIQMLSTEDMQANLLAQRAANSEPAWCYWSTAYELTQAGTVGALTGVLVALFKLSIEFVRSVCYEEDILVAQPELVALIPALGGIIVGLLLLFGGAYPPGLRGTIQEVDDRTMKAASSGSQPALSWENISQELKRQGNFLRKSTASVATLGSGCSLGPEGPCVEIGLNVARASTSFNRPVPSREAGSAIASESTGTPPSEQTTNAAIMTNLPASGAWNRVLLSCGAAAGVAAGFNAPIAGVFFALEIMQNSFQDIDQDNLLNGRGNGSSSNNIESAAMNPSITSTTTITPILIASVLAALISQSLLGNHLVLTLTQFDLETPLVELPLYLALGALSGVVAFIFTYTAKVAQRFFDGELGAEVIKDNMSSIPKPIKPILGGLICGLVGLVFPQILFFGYETLNSLLKNNTLPLSLILTLMGVKTITTAVSAGSGLVGGTFAPSLFLGAMLGSAFHDGATILLQAVNSNSWITALAGIDKNLEIAGLPAYAMVGAASVLAALFRAPLTASLLLFEITRNYDVILPLMASAGVGSIVGDILEDRLERREEMQRRDQDPVSWGDLSFPNDPNVAQRFDSVSVISSSVQQRRPTLTMQTNGNSNTTVLITDEEKQQ